MTRTIVVDHDGTITEEDLLQQVSVLFGDPAVVSEVEEALREGRISLREEITREYVLVRAPLEEVVDWVLEHVRQTLARSEQRVEKSRQSALLSPRQKAVRDACLDSLQRVRRTIDQFD